MAIVDGTNDGVSPLDCLPSSRNRLVSIGIMFKLVGLPTTRAYLLLRLRGRRYVHCLKQ
ncbi:hypothetical protein BDN72DRAFT_844704 [Pluteus cervinus]|uniref:Uncharacterized protein n=1 Tax=Pluteus cervinus TaxID=181527 RepID=A0ACD3AKU0_9AGAR|nr:hypothetical protein BDN72DRAFT_844704 [Pluteus cervinus]